MDSNILLIVIMGYFLFGCGIWLIVSILKGKQNGKNKWILSAAIVPLISFGIYTTGVLIDYEMFGPHAEFGFFTIILSVIYAAIVYKLVPKYSCTSEGIGTVVSVQVFKERYGRDTISLIVNYEVDEIDYTEGCISVNEKFNYDVGDKVLIKYDPNTPKTVKVVGKV